MVARGRPDARGDELQGARQDARNGISTAAQRPGDELPGELGVVGFVTCDALQDGTDVRCLSNVQAGTRDEGGHRFTEAAINERALRQAGEIGVDA